MIGISGNENLFLAVTHPTRITKDNFQTGYNTKKLIYFLIYYYLLIE